MADNSLIFDTVRPWLDSTGFNDPRRVAALNAACAALSTSADNSPVFNAVRPMLNAKGFTPERIAALDAVCAQFRGASPAPVPSVPVPPPAGDDRYVPLFQHLASTGADPETVKTMARSFAAHAPRYGQDRSKPRIAEFVAQIANETGGFRVFEENLHYSARRLMQVWPKKFPTLASALPYGWDPSDPDREDIALANRTYGNRMGNERDGTNDDDGWEYRGRGALQLTGFDNYKRYGELTGVDLVNHPELAADPADSVLIALEFFKQGNVNAAIDRGDFKEARRITNGAALGLGSVATLRAKALAVL